MVLFSAMETKTHIFRLALVCLPFTNYIWSYQNTSVIRIQYAYVQRVPLTTYVYIIQNYNKLGNSNKDSFLNIFILHFYHIYIYIRLYIYPSSMFDMPKYKEYWSSTAVKHIFMVTTVPPQLHLVSCWFVRKLLFIISIKTYVNDKHGNTFRIP